MKHIMEPSFALDGVTKELLLPPQAKMVKSKFGPKVVCLDLALSKELNQCME